MGGSETPAFEAVCAFFHRIHVGKGTGDNHVSPRRRAVARPKGDLDGLDDDLAGSLGTARSLEHQARAGIGVGGDHVGAGSDVILVDGAEQVRCAQRRQGTPGGVVHVGAAAFKFCPGGTVEQQHRTVPQALRDIRHDDPKPPL